MFNTVKVRKLEMNISSHVVYPQTVHPCVIYNTSVLFNWEEQAAHIFTMNLYCVKIDLILPMFHS